MEKEFEIKLRELEPKLRRETNIGVYTKEEQLLIDYAYKEVTGKVVSKNCSGCYTTARKILINYLNILDKEVKEVEVKEEAIIIERTDEVKPKQVRKPRKKKDGWTRIVNIESLDIDGNYVYLKDYSQREFKDVYQATWDGEEWSFTDNLGNDVEDWEGTPTEFKLVNDK